MNQIRLFVVTTREPAARISRALEAAFEEDGLPVASFEIDEDRDIWSVSVYALPDMVHAAERRMAQVLGEINPSIAIEREALGDVDWVSVTLEALNPVRAGRFVVHGSHDRDAARANEIGILIDAGLAFGTGHHGTTAGCLEMLGEAMKRRRFYNALDLGAGSGVLAIAAARAQPLTALASDIDPVAVRVARENARLNRVGGRVECICATGFNHRRFVETGPYDLILANILARPLEQMARDLARHCASGATVILSGLLPHQKARIVAAYRQQGLRLVRAHRLNGWLTLVLEF